jgi:hypothetical protein
VDRDACRPKKFALGVVELIVADERGKLEVALSFPGDFQHELVLVIGVKEQLGRVKVRAADLEICGELGPVVFGAMCRVDVEVALSILASDDHAMECLEVRAGMIIELFDRRPSSENLRRSSTLGRCDLMKITIAFVVWLWVENFKPLADRGDEVDRDEWIIEGGG